MESDPEPEPTINLAMQFILIAVLILINAFFASAEIALISLNKNKVKLLAKDGSKRAQILTRIIDEPEMFLATIRTVITLLILMSAAIAYKGIFNPFESFLEQINISYSEEISFIVIIVGLSYFTLVFSELFPKRIALEKPEFIAMISVYPIYCLSKLIFPFVKLISMSTNILVKIVGVDRDKRKEKVSQDDIKTLVKAGQEHGIINEIEKDMINSIFEFNDKLAKEVMTPRTEVFLIDQNSPVSQLLDKLLEEQYSRIPVYDDDVDNIVGILYMKDFIIEARKFGFDNVDIKKILHPPYFVQESKNVDVLFKELQSSKNHMAIIIDEYGGFSGVVTIEDIIEEVMGNIQDEYDDDEPDIKEIDDNTYIARGLLSLDELNDHLDLNLESENYDTLGGFLISRIGRIPKKDEEKIIEYNNVIFKIEEVKEKRIEKVKICMQKIAL
ncbi:MAG: hemolysin family protein [Clostridiaceae bacterium]